MTTSVREDFRIPGYMAAAAADDDGGEEHDDGDGNALPCHYPRYFHPTSRKWTLNHYWEVDEEDQ